MKALAVQKGHHNTQCLTSLWITLLQEHHQGWLEARRSCVTGSEGGSEAQLETGGVQGSGTFWSWQTPRRGRAGYGQASEWQIQKFSRAAGLCRVCFNHADLVQIKHPSVELQWEGSFIYKLLTFHSDFHFALPFVRKLSFVLFCSILFCNAPFHDEVGLGPATSKLFCAPFTATLHV